MQNHSQLLVAFHEFSKKIQKIDLDKLPQKQVAKLKYLGSMISQEQTSLKQLKEVNLIKNIGKDQAEIIKMLSFQQQIDSYFTLAEQIIEINNNEQLISEMLYIYSQSQKEWKQREIILNKANSILVIKKSNQKEKKVFLQFYIIKWQGEQDQKYCIQLEKLNIQQKNRNILMGTESYLQSNQWYNILKNLIDNFNYEKKQQRLTSNNILNNKDVYQKQRLTLQYQQQLQSQSNQTTDSPSKKLKLQQQQKLNGSNQLHDTEEEEKKFFDYQNTDDSQQINKYNETLLQQQQQQFYNDLNQNGFNSEFGEQIQIQDNYLPGNPYNMQHVRKLNNNDSFNSQKSDSNQPVDQEEQQESIENKKEREDQQLISEILSEEEFQIEEIQEKYRILKHNSNTKRFKLKYTFNCSVMQLVNILNNFLNYKTWNKQIEHIQVLKYLPNQQSLIIQQQNRAYGMLYLPRVFIFLRSISILNENSVYINDQSISYEECEPDSYNVVRGLIKNANWYFQYCKDLGNNQLILDIEISQSGYSNSKQDRQMTIEYLKNITFLENVALQQPQQEICFALEKLNFQFKECMYLSNGVKNKNTLDLNDPLLKLSESYEQNQRQYYEEIEDDQDSNELIEDENIDLDNNDLQQFQLERKQNTQVKTVYYDTAEDYIHHVEIEEVMKVEELPIENVENYQNKVSKDILKYVQSNLHWNNCINKKFIMHPIKVQKKIITSSEIGGHYVFKHDYIRDEKKGILVFVNEDLLKKQKQVLNYMLTSIGKNLFTGKSIVNISLPIKIFDFKSYLERIAYGFQFAPVYLGNAAQQQDPIAQMKNCIAFSITNFLMMLDLKKPFNPILGETFQCRIDGCPVYLEQISHHPPITALQFYGRDFQLQGNLENVANMHANSVTSSNQGNLNVKFHKTGNTISLQMAGFLLEGTMIGKRTVNLEHTLYAWDLDNRLFAEIVFNPDKKGLLDFSSQKTPSDYFKGRIYEVNEQFVLSFKKIGARIYNQKNKQIFEKLQVKKDVVKIISNVDGIWDQQIIIDDEIYWNRESPLPFVMQYEENALASDSVFREDSIIWRMGDEKQGTFLKEKLEQIQRNDRKLRKELGGNKKKDKKKDKKSQ